MKNFLNVLFLSVFVLSSISLEAYSENNVSADAEVKITGNIYIDNGFVYDSSGLVISFDRVTLTKPGSEALSKVAIGETVKFSAHGSEFVGTYKGRPDENSDHIVDPIYRTGPSKNSEKGAPFEVIGVGEKNSMAGGSNNGNGTNLTPGDFSVGLGAGIVAGATTAIISASGFEEDIKNSQKNIDRLRKEIKKHEDKIIKASINLTTSALNLKFSSTVNQNLANEIRQSVQLGDFNVNAFIDIDSERQNLANYEWQSEDVSFQEEANEIKDILVNSEFKDHIDQKFYEISKESLYLADEESTLGNSENAEFLLDVARTTADVLVGLDPFTGLARSLYETVTGKNIVNGRDLTNGERVLAFVGIFTAGYLLKAYRIFKVLKPLVQKIAPALMKTFNYIKKFLNKTGNGFQLIGEGSLVRKIIFRGMADPKWGLNPRHLNKHFFGKGKTSLKSLDPGGSADKWMQEFVDLTQRPVTDKLANGVVDIFHYYPKSNGSGFYRLGIRLNKAPDGSYDLITVLTKQTK